MKVIIVYKIALVSTFGLDSDSVFELYIDNGELKKKG